MYRPGRVHTLGIALIVAAGCSHPIAGQGIHFELPESDQVRVRTMSLGEGRVDLFFPTTVSSQPLPTVVFVIGHPDDATSLGPLLDHPHYRDWASITAAAGFVAVLYSVREPVADLARVADFIVARGPDLGIDVDRVALWSASANVPTALHYARNHGPLKPRALVAYYGLMPTPDGFQQDSLQAASARAGFALPSYERGQTYPADLALLVVRAGLDGSAALLASIDRFIEFGITENLPLRVLNYPGGQHSFDSRDDTPETRLVIAETLAFLSLHLQP